MTNSFLSCLVLFWCGEKRKKEDIFQMELASKKAAPVPSSLHPRLMQARRLGRALRPLHCPGVWLQHLPLTGLLAQDLSKNPFLSFRTLSLLMSRYTAGLSWWAITCLGEDAWKQFLTHCLRHSKWTAGCTSFLHSSKAPWNEQTPSKCERKLMECLFWVISFITWHQVLREMTSSDFSRSCLPSGQLQVLLNLTPRERQSKVTLSPSSAETGSGGVCVCVRMCVYLCVCVS